MPARLTRVVAADSLDDPLKDSLDEAPAVLLDSALETAAAAARAAGDQLRDAMSGDLGLRAKGAAGDVVSALDLAAEKLIVSRIQRDFPEHRVVAEEAGGEASADDPWVWLVDPLDGTNNLAIGLNAFVVGIALCHRGRPVVSVVHDPISRRTWSAVRGQGARGPGDVPLRPSRRPWRGGPVIAWTQGHSVPRQQHTARALRFVLDNTARRVLALWAPLAGWAMAARGDIDGVIGYAPESVDLPAGTLLAREAGLAVRALDGTPFDDRFDRPALERSFVAAHPDAVDELLDLVSRAARIEPSISALTSA